MAIKGKENPKYYEDHSPVDSVGRIERTGIDFIPDEVRRSTPINIWWILLGGSLTFSIIIIGWIPVSLGLSWWATISAILVGSLIGSTLLASMAAFGMKTGTNNPVSSGAHFGVVGRIGGSVVGISGALIFAALSVWTAGDALSQSASRLLAIESGITLTFASYALIAVIMTVIAVMGHANMLIFQKLMVPTAGLMMIIGVFVFWPSFDSGYAGAELALGTFWPTWFLGVAVVAATTQSWAPFLGDWARHISSQRFTSKRVITITWLGGFFAMGGTYVFGAYTAVALTDPTGPYVAGLVHDAPYWYLFPILYLGLVAGTAQAIINIYGMGLDFSAIFASLSRIQATLVLAVIATTIVYAGAIFSSLESVVNSLLSILIVITAPWVIINVVGMFNRKGHYYPQDLQVFNRGEVGGRYWFTGGINIRAGAAWVCASLVGLLFTNAGFFTGPGVELFGGVDIGFIVAGVTAGIMYYILLLIAPEPQYVFGPRGALFGSNSSIKRQPSISSGKAAS